MKWKKKEHTLPGNTRCKMYTFKKQAFNSVISIISGIKFNMDKTAFKKYLPQQYFVHRIQFYLFKKQKQFV